MGYLFTAISVFCGLCKGGFGKVVSRYTNEYRDAVVSNLMRMLLCIAIGFGMVALNGGASTLAVSGQTLLIAALSGIVTSAFIIIWLFAIKLDYYVVISVFLMIGNIFTVVMCRIFYNEPIYLNQYIGFAVLIGATFIMCAPSGGNGKKMTLKALAILLGCGITNGLADFTQKVFVHAQSGATNAAFNFYTYVFATITLTIALMLAKTEHKDNVAQHTKYIIKSTIVYIAIMAVSLFGNSYFKVLAAANMDSALLYPLFQGSGLILSAIMARIFFKEKISVKKAIGMVLAFAALCMINL